MVVFGERLGEKLKKKSAKSRKIATPQTKAVKSEARELGQRTQSMSRLR
jgi:hypothetical protein